MSQKAAKCCCCPLCTVDTMCGCTLKRLCITLDVTDPGTCDDPYKEPCCCTGQCIETSWNAAEQAWIGAFQCGGIEFDFRYYFARDEYDGSLLFKMRSVALGYVGENELVFRHGEDFNCAIGDLDDTPPLSTSAEISLAPLDVACTVATITTRSVYRLRPTCCTSCKCLPECLFADLNICGAGNPAGFSHGILCFDEDQDRYEGFVTENNGTQHDVFISFRPRCLFVATAADPSGGHELILAEPYADVDPYDPCALPIPDYGDPACTADSECVVVIEIPDANYRKWHEQSDDISIGLAAICDGFGRIAQADFGVVTGDRGTAGFHAQDAPCERIDTPTAGPECDCKTYSGGTGGTILSGGAIPLTGSPLPLLIRGCQQVCDACEDFWIDCYKDATLPPEVYEPSPACCGYFWGEGAGGVCVLIWCDGTDWQAEQYCRTGSPGSYVYTLAGDMTVDVDCIPGTRPQLSAEIVECCGRCHPCFLCNWPTPVNIVVTSSPSIHNFTGVVAWDGTTGTGIGEGAAGGIHCWAFNTGSDRMSIELNMNEDGCSLRIGCNGTDCMTFNCVIFPTVTVNSCDPLDITITCTVGGLFCGACGSAALTIHIFE